MKDADAKLDRAQALLDLLEKFSRKLPDDMPEEKRNAEAILKLDEKLGPEWKREIERAGLQLPKARGCGTRMMSKREATENMYKKVRSLLEDEGVHADNLSSRLNGEDEEEDEVRIILLGKHDRG